MDILNPSKFLSIDSDKKSYQVPGKIIRISEDRQRHEWIYILTKDEDSGAKVFVHHYDEF